MKRISSALIIVSFLSCNTLQLNQYVSVTTKRAVELGSIGKVKGVIENSFQINSFPTYQKKIRVAIQVVSFNKSSLKRYNRAAKHQKGAVKLVLKDSLIPTYKYVNLKLLDKVQLLNQLNGQHNKSVKTYLQNARGDEMITGISAYFDQQMMNNLLQADEVYLINNKPQKYSLELVKAGSSFAVLDVSKAVTFAFTTASFCWKKELGNYNIVNIVEGLEGCEKNTYSHVNRFPKEKKY